MIDGVKLVVLGGTVETARRMASSGWYVAHSFAVRTRPHSLTHASSSRSHFINCAFSISFLK